MATTAESELELDVVTRARREVDARRARRVGGRQRTWARWANRWIPAHWLAAFNTVNALIVVGTVLAPWLRAEGSDRLAGVVYAFYHLQCPQRPSHSLFLFGYKMGMEARMVAIYAGWLVAGVGFGRLRGRVRPLRLPGLVLLSLPLLLDVGSQRVGMREGTAGWRIATGLLFAAASAWWGLPRAEHGLGLDTAAASARAASRERSPAMWDDEHQVGSPVSGS